MPRPAHSETQRLCYHPSAACRGRHATTVGKTEQEKAKAETPVSDGDLYKETARKRAELKISHYKRKLEGGAAKNWFLRLHGRCREKCGHFANHGQDKSLIAVGKRGAVFLNF